ncbi:potassium/proton antiporter [Haematospirillum sp. 15-248]|uniref:potassium/proton antiporter n=1 Tax=Haematospirillum sp. 15-248 TaxID=2723107 RepID=UPI00143BABB9|nr:potassium/proton antiporter [Haematospirillum sp. 15-248]NKD87215.1 potassium/proton antiporter [Haematospirillum sp. 15-248]
METANHLILIGGSLLLVAILTGALSTRIGAPLLLVFLGFGMLAGEDGPGGIRFSNFEAIYTAASVAVAIILFDGGLRTSFRSVRRSWGRAAALATVGVVITAVITGITAWVAFDSGVLVALLTGTVVASTDAAAVFLLLHQQGSAVRERVSSTLELESGANDPMAVLLTVTLVGMIQTNGSTTDSLVTSGLSLLQAFSVGTAIGIGGGAALAFLVNRTLLAPGLYPVMLIAGALSLYGISHVMGGSGFLTVYLAGIVAGNQRLRAQSVILRFHDGIAWVSQLVLLVGLGLLVTPHQLLPDLGPALAIALTMVFIARPVAVALCLAGSRFALRERAFIAWVGLRGGVPIYLAIIPVLAGIPEAQRIFNITFTVVLVSLTLQGWTIGLAARLLKIEIPPAPAQEGRLEVDIPSNMDRDIVGYTVGESCPMAGRPVSELSLPQRTRILAVLRSGLVVPERMLHTLKTGDFVLFLAPPEHSLTLDRQFLSNSRKKSNTALGDFVIPGATALGPVSLAYEIPVDGPVEGVTIAEWLREHLADTPSIGDAVSAGPVELVVVQTEGDEIISVGIRLDPTRLDLWDKILRYLPRWLRVHIHTHE